MSLKQIENNSIVVVPKYKKINVIKELNNQFLNIKIMTLDELIKKLTFDYDDKTIYNLMKYENVKYEIAKNYIKNIYYVENKDYKNVKLNKLVSIKKYLEDNNLLKYDNLFRKFLNNKNIYIIGYDYIDKYSSKILKTIENCKIEIINNNYNSYEPKIYEFNTITEEIEFVAFNICELINNNVDINKIKLVNVGSDYYNEIRRIFKFYNIPINLSEKNIYGTSIVKDFINFYEEDINNTLERLKNIYDLNNEVNMNIYNKIIDVCNQYNWCSNYLEIKELIINKLKNTKISNNYTNCIEITNLENIDCEYTFILNFNQGNIPKIYKDEEYIDDLNRQILDIETSVENNIIEKEKVIKNIKNIKNVIITYKLKTPFASFYPSSIIENLSSNIIRKQDESLISYSEIYDKIKLTKKIDNLIKYGINDSYLEILYNNYEIDYDTYNNQYTKINKDKLLQYLDNKLLLSYSSLDNYYHCGFRYYIGNVLKLNTYEESLSTKIGNLFHYVLEKTLKNDVSYKEYWDNYICELELSNKERFLIDELENNMIFTIETIKKHLKHCSLTNTLYEEKIYVNKNSKITFMGVIDKLMYEEVDGKTIIAVIDYKTGNTNIDLDKTYYGLSMQLPIYLYLASKSSLKNIEVAGFYLQNIINNETTTKSDDNQKEKEDSLKLNGYSNSKQSVLKYFDSSYENSEVVKSLKTKSDGNFYSYSKVLSNDQISNLISLVDKKIEDASDDILDAKFDINPKQIGFKKDSLIGCKYCTFKDICFKKEKDIVILKEQDYKEFLGGDFNA